MSILLVGKLVEVGLLIGMIRSASFDEGSNQIWIRFARKLLRSKLNKKSALWDQSFFLEGDDFLKVLK
ncbi:hypothetical protein TSO5_05155 [Azospirillum sp. TSO5]|nr:hypothetical protein TSO5_05155 [Azospirillum sp. TSO5]